MPLTRLHLFESWIRLVIAQARTAPDPEEHHSQQKQDMCCQRRRSRQPTHFPSRASNRATHSLFRWLNSRVRAFLVLGWPRTELSGVAYLAQAKNLNL